MKIFISGAGGFVGRALLNRLLEEANFYLLGAVRENGVALPGGVQKVIIPDLSDSESYVNVLDGVSVVVHLAGRAHVLNEVSINPLFEFRRVNVHATKVLARSALLAGVKRFIFVSSIGVNGSQTHGVPFSEMDLPDPNDDYAVSKLEAEVALREIFSGTNTEFVVIRPPLVYGPDAPGNFGRLVNLVLSGIPLPLGAVNNKRSFISLYNLVDVIYRCLDHPAAANQTFIVGDGVDLTTTDLLKLIAEAFGLKARLFSMPTAILLGAAMVFGKKRVALRLCGDLQLDISKVRTLLDWNPPVTVEEGLRRVAAGHCSIR